MFTIWCPAILLTAEHSQRLESYFQSIPGVQLVAVSTVANAKALLKSVSEETVFGLLLQQQVWV
jgi:pyruvate/2-oxoglutarate/acetoin dehydrogenase E1 component